MKTLDIIEQGFAQEQEKLNKRRKSWREYKRTQHYLTTLVADLMKMGPLNDLVLSDHDWINMRISGDKHKLAQVVRTLRTRGYTTTEAPPAKGAREWKPIFSKAGAPSIFLMFTGNSCRLVKVGTKMVEQAVYETVCDEITLDRSAEDAAAANPELVAEVDDAIPF